VLARIGGMMALLEGHGDIVMNRAGQGLVPSADRFDRVLKQRRAQASPAVKMIQKLAGIEAKMNQYQLGEHFIEAIEQVGGERIVDRCWEGPEQLPTMDEIREPAAWLRRLNVASHV
jgi:putative hydrolase